jgi:hypothetical protein
VVSGNKRKADVAQRNSGFPAFHLLFQTVSITFVALKSNYRRSQCSAALVSRSDISSTASGKLKEISILELASLLYRPQMDDYHAENND